MLSVWTILNILVHFCKITVMFVLTQAFQVPTWHIDSHYHNLHNWELDKTLTTDAHHFSNEGGWGRGEKA